MTTAEMHTFFKLELDKAPISSYPSFLPEEIDFWLNKAYLAIINQKFTGNNFSKSGFEGSQKRISDLSKLIVSVSNATTPCVSSPTSVATPADFLYFIDGIIKHKDENGVETASNMLSVSHEDSLRFKKTKTNKPVIVNPVMVQEGSSLIIYFDEVTTKPLSSTVMTTDYAYISKPSKIDNTTPTAVPLIAEHVHGEIVSLAAFLAIENIESPRFQSSATTLTIQE